MLTVCRKDKNKEKEAGHCPFFKKIRSLLHILPPSFGEGRIVFINVLYKNLHPLDATQLTRRLDKISIHWQCDQI